MYDKDLCVVDSSVAAVLQLSTPLVNRLQLAVSVFIGSLCIRLICGIHTLLHSLPMVTVTCLPRVYSYDGQYRFISLASQASKTVKSRRETLSASPSQEAVVPQGLRSAFRLIGRCGLLQIPVKRGELCAALVDMRQHGKTFRSELGTRVIEQPAD